jgi:PPOX class probable F420-dependent enzyme
MSLPIAENFLDLFSRPLLCALTTINPDGQPHSVPVWFDYDGERVRFNAPAATKKARNLEVNSKVTLLIIDPANDFHWIEIQGYVAEMRDEAHGAREHINQLSARYTGIPIYQGFGRSGENRQMYIVEATKINGF